MRRNCCSSHIKQERNLDIKDVTDNKTFWETIRPLFSDRKRHGNGVVFRIPDPPTINQCYDRKKRPT